MAPATQHPGLLQSREGWWKYGGTRGSTRKSLRPPPNSPHPADLEEPLLLLRADMAAGLARLGIWVLGSCHSPSLPSSYPSRPHPTPSNYPRATHPSLGSQSSLQAEMCPITRQYQTTGFLNSPQTRLIQLPKQSPQGGRALSLLERKGGAPVTGVIPLLSSGDRGQGGGGGGRGLLVTWAQKCEHLFLQRGQDLHISP